MVGRGWSYCERALVSVDAIHSFEEESVEGNFFWLIVVVLWLSIEVEVLVYSNGFLGLGHVLRGE